MKVLTVAYQSDKTKPVDHSLIWHYSFKENGLNSHLVTQHDNFPDDDFDLIFEVEYGEAHRPEIEQRDEPKFFRGIDLHALYKRGFYQRIEKVFNTIFSAVHPSNVRYISRDKLVWLPLFAPDHFYPIDVEEKYDVAFFGEIGGFRNELVKNLRRWAEEEGWKLWIGQEYDWRRLNELINQSKIQVSLSKSFDIPRRCFMVMGSGTLLLTEKNPASHIEDLFTDWKHLVYYNNFDHLKELLLYFLQDENERKKVAQKGYEEVEKYHRISHRIEKVVETCNRKI